jgi:hypothetical protein
MVAFEKEVANFEIMNFFYGYVARTALNAQLFKDSYSYALAGVETCKINKDEEGVRANQQILCDIAAATSNFKIASDYYLLANPGSKNSDDLRFLINLSEKVESTPINFKTNKKPPSFKYCSSDLGRDERALRYLMKTMGISKNEAKKYAKASMHTQIN